MKSDLAEVQVLADRTQLQQVLLNLLMNALEAMQDTPPERRLVCVSLRPNGPQGMVLVAVEDRFDGGGNVAVAGDEDDRNGRHQLGKSLLDLQSAGVGQAQIEHQATGTVVAFTVQELAGRGKSLETAALRPDEPLHRTTHRGIIIHQIDTGVAEING